MSKEKFVPKEKIFCVIIQDICTALIFDRSVEAKAVDVLPQNESEEWEE